MRTKSLLALQHSLLICLFTAIPTLYAADPRAAASDFETTVKGKCVQWSYLYNVNGIDCESVWTEFVAILTNEKVKNMCKMDSSLFQTYAEKWFRLTPEFPYATFWSDVLDLIRPLCKDLRLCRTIETTLVGYIFDGLDWCDTKFTGGVVYATQCGCTGKAEMVNAFWDGASLVYSKWASGSVQIILNGSIPKPFDPNSTFGSVELPNLVYPRVQNATVYVVKNLNDTNNSPMCTSNSLLNLKSTLSTQRVTFNCVENPPFIVHLLCTSDPYNRKCLLNSARTLTLTALTILLPLVLRWTF